MSLFWLWIIKYFNSHGIKTLTLVSDVQVIHFVWTKKSTFLLIPAIDSRISNFSPSVCPWCLLVLTCVTVRNSAVQLRQKTSYSWWKFSSLFRISSRPVLARYCKTTIIASLHKLPISSFITLIRFLVVGLVIQFVLKNVHPFRNHVK